MTGQMETAFDLLRAWDFTNIYEKSYFILVHFALLLLGIYSIKNRIFGGKARLRPSSPSSLSAQCLKDDNDRTAGSQESSCKQDMDLKWASETAYWLLKDSYASDTINTWRSKMNVRLLQNMNEVGKYCDFATD